MQAPAQNHEQQSRNLSVEINLIRRRSLDEDVIHINSEQDAPDHPQESHHRLEDLGQDPGTTLETKGKDLPSKRPSGPSHAPA